MTDKDFVNKYLKDFSLLSGPNEEIVDKIIVKQDSILPMKFNINISKRAVRYFMQVIDLILEIMPYTTRLYFLKVQEIMSVEMDKSLV